MNQNIASRSKVNNVVCLQSREVLGWAFILFGMAQRPEADTYAISLDRQNLKAGTVEPAIRPRAAVLGNLHNMVAKRSKVDREVVTAKRRERGNPIHRLRRVIVNTVPQHHKSIDIVLRRACYIVGEYYRHSLWQPAEFHHVSSVPVILTRTPSGS